MTTNVPRATKRRPAAAVEARQARTWPRRWAVSAAMGLATAALLTVSFPPFDLWPAGFLALVPWLWALRISRGGWGLVGVTAVVSMAFWGGNLYWLWTITLPGYFAVLVVLWAAWLLTAWPLRMAMRRRWPVWIVLPVIWVAGEYLRAYVLSGFPWFFLSHGQYRVIPLIQIADLAGPYGVSFVVAMCNGAVVDAIAWRAAGAERARLHRQWLIGTVATVAMLGAVLGYGFWRVAQTPRATSPGPVVGLVQHAFPIALYDPGVTRETIYEQHVQYTRLLPQAGLDLIVWPETMLPGFLNPEALALDVSGMSGQEVRAVARGMGYRDVWSNPPTDEQVRLVVASEIHRYRRFAAEMTALAQERGAAILAGGSTLQPNAEPIDRDDAWFVENSAIWFDPQLGPGAVYSKMHLVPFGEYVPLKRSWPAAHRAMRWFVPDVMNQLEPGREVVHFELSTDQAEYTLVAPICYEGVFARVGRRLVMHTGRKPRNLLMVNLSNDGWFVRRSGGEWVGTTEQSQHLAHYVYRAVETRVPVVRAVNTGISASIDSTGRLVAEVADPATGRRTMVSGAMLLDGGELDGAHGSVIRGPRVLVDDRVTVYSLVGNVFAQVVSVGAIALLAVLWARRGRVAGKQKGLEP